MAREAPRRLRGALGEALVVVRFAEEAVAVVVGALVRHFYQFDAVAAQEPKFRTDWYWAGLWSCFLGSSAVRAALSWVCALTRKAWTLLRKLLPAITRWPLIISLPHISTRD